MTCMTCHGQSVHQIHQIWSFYLWSFQRYKGGSKISKIVTWPLGHVTIFDNGHVTLRSRDHYRNFDPVRGQIFIFWQRVSCRVSYMRPTKFGVRSIIHSNVMEGSQILNLGHVTLTTPTLGVICYPVANTCYVAYACQIWSLYVKPFGRYWQNLHCACAVSRDT